VSERMNWIQIVVGVVALACLTTALVAGCAAVPVGGDDGAVGARLTGGSIPGGDDIPPGPRTGDPVPVESGESTPVPPPPGP